jgi:hypothetical protein
MGQRRGDEGAIAIAQVDDSFDRRSQKAREGDRSQMQEEGTS